MGALPASKAEYNDFITRNKATKFENHFEAKVMCALIFIKKAHNKIVLPFFQTALQNNVTKAMAVGGWRVGWRLGLFSGAYM